MSSLTIRRIVVWIVSMGLGVLSAYLIITVGFASLPFIKIGTIITPVQSHAITIGEYGIIYFITTAFPLGMLFLVWLDYFLDTKILPD